MARWLLPSTALLIGAAAGIGSFTFGYARGYSYLTRDPAACANCHVMDEHYAAWLKSSHRAVAVCNDCHTPHALVPKYLTKARNGFWHSFYFTTGIFPYPLRITARNHAIVEDACRNCHARLADDVDRFGVPRGTWARHADLAEASCVRCHRYVGHWIR